MKRLIVIAGLAIALVAAGCGSSGGGSTSGGSTPASTPAPSSGSATLVHMKGIQFNPKTLTVNKGATVEWVNDDSVPHDVTKTTGPGAQFSSGSGDLNNGDTYRVTFKDAGTVKYECTVHPGMTGEIVVK
jgi:plastocyanin